MSAIYPSHVALLGRSFGCGRTMRVRASLDTQVSPSVPNSLQGWSVAYVSLNNLCHLKHYSIELPSGERIARLLSMYPVDDPGSGFDESRDILDLWDPLRSRPRATPSSLRCLNRVPLDEGFGELLVPRYEILRQRPEKPRLGKKIQLLLYGLLLKSVHHLSNRLRGDLIPAHPMLHEGFATV